MTLPPGIFSSDLANRQPETVRTVDPEQRMMEGGPGMETFFEHFPVNCCVRNYILKTFELPGDKCSLSCICYQYNYWQSRQIWDTCPMGTRTRHKGEIYPFLPEIRHLALWICDFGIEIDLF